MSAVSTFNPVNADTVSDEAIVGDFSNDPDAPTFLDVMPGNNNLIGTVGPFDTDFEDHITFTIDANESLDAIIVDFFDPDINGTSGNLTTVIQVNPGAIFDFPNLISSITVSTQFSIGTDILPPGNLGPGDYTIRLGEAQGPAAYDLNVQVSAVPEPSSAILFFSGLGIFARRRR